MDDTGGFSDLAKELKYFKDFFQLRRFFGKLFQLGKFSRTFKSFDALACSSYCHKDAGHAFFFQRLRDQPKKSVRSRLVFLLHFSFFSAVFHLCCQNSTEKWDCSLFQVTVWSVIVGMFAKGMPYPIH